MVSANQQHIQVTRSALFLLCLMLITMLSCSSTSKSGKKGVAVEGTSVSLDDLDYTEGLNAPVPDEKKPPPGATSSDQSVQAKAETRDASRSFLSPDRIRHLRKRVFVLPFSNDSDYREQAFGQIASQKLIQALEESDQVVVLDDRLLDRFITERGIAHDALLNPFWIRRLHRAFGVHAVVSGALANLNVATTKSAVSQDIEVGLAMARVEARLVDAATGMVLRTYVGRNPLYKSKEIGEFNQERAILRAIGIGVDEISRGVLDSLKFFDWSARVIQIEPARIYIDAGQQSGLRTGDILEVYGQGKEIINPVNQLSLGWAPGDLKGKIQVSGFFGVDGAYAAPLEGNGFSIEDTVKLSRIRPEPNE
jgi:hypothetical protein